MLATSLAAMASAPHTGVKNNVEIDHKKHFDKKKRNANNGEMP